MKTTQEKSLQRCIIYPIAKDADPSQGVKMEQKLPFLIFNTIFIYQSGLVLFFLNLLDGQCGHF